MTDNEMRCVILQPSFIPWRGYFHQIQKSEFFVFYDCVQYDKRGWRNRNRIKTANGVHWLTIPIAASETGRGNLIRNTMISENSNWREKHLSTLYHGYSKAPFWKEYNTLLKDIYSFSGSKITDITCASIEIIARRLGINHTRFIRSSTLNASGQKTDRLIHILRQIGATHYITGPSAKDYIEESKFENIGIKIEYMNYNYPQYPQMHGKFEEHVSILDLLFNVGPEAPYYIWKRKF